MTKPTTYEIVLKGNVGARSLRPLIDDFTITDSEPGITRLVGVIRDASQMHGLVAHLASVGVELLAIVPKEGNLTMTNQPQATSQADELAKTERIEAARQHVHQLQAFYIHAGMFAAGMAIIFVVNLATNLSAGTAGEWPAWWSLWALLGWGLGIVIHGLVVWLNRPLPSSPTWEQRQIDKVLAR